MLAVMGIMTLPTLFKGKLQRWQGISLLAIYVAFMFMQFVFVRTA
jgi:Ca2+/Na+ antiporter